MQSVVECAETDVVDWRVQAWRTWRVEHILEESLQFAFKLYERQREEGHYFLHAHPEEPKSWYEEFVKKLSREEHVEKLRVNMDGIVNNMVVHSLQQSALPLTVQETSVREGRYQVGVDSCSRACTAQLTRQRTS